MALLSYVTRRVPPASEVVRGHLSSAQCQKLRSHIRENLSGELSLFQLASLVGLGPRATSPRCSVAPSAARRTNT